MKIIALLGKSRVGKDTAATIFSEAFGFPIVRLASPVKDAVHVLFDIPRGHLDSYQKEVIDPRYGKTPRDLMVWLTSVIQRDFSKDFFFRRLRERFPSDIQGIVIPDVRFAHDVSMLRDHGATIIKITRNNAPVCHAHEDGIDALSGHLWLKNDDTLEDFEMEVSRTAEFLRAGFLRDGIFRRGGQGS